MYCICAHKALCAAQMCIMNKETEPGSGAGYEDKLASEGNAAVADEDVQ